MAIHKQYMRDAQRNKIGVMVAIKDGNEIYLGFSKCNTSKDEFDRTIGTQIAIGRARKYHNKYFDEIRTLLPDSVQRQVTDFATSVVARNPACIFPCWVYR